MSVRSCRSLMGHCVRPGLPPQNPVTDCANPRRCVPERDAGPPMMVPPAAGSAHPRAPALSVKPDRSSRHSSLAGGRGYLERVADVCVAPSPQRGGHQRFETLAADPVRRLPDHNQRIADCLIIKSARGPGSAPCGLFAAQRPHGVLAMKTGHCDELIQNAAFPPTLAISVSLSYRYHQFISRRHGDPPHPRLHSRISVGSKLDEATAQYPGAFLARQCAGGPAMSRHVIVGNPVRDAMEAQRCGQPIEQRRCVAAIDCFDDTMLLELGLEVIDERW